MFESLDRAFSRRQGGPTHMTPVITTVDDIRRVVSALDPGNRSKTDEVVVNTDMVGSNQENGQAKFQVSARMTSYSQRDMLVKALGDVKKRQDRITQLSTKDVEPLLVGGKMAETCKMVDTRLPIDDIITRVYGGRRDGVDICWDLTDGYTYRYDVFNHKLTRVKQSEANSH